MTRFTFAAGTVAVLLAVPAPVQGFGKHPHPGFGSHKVHGYAVPVAPAAPTGMPVVGYVPVAGVGAPVRTGFCGTGFGCAPAAGVPVVGLPVGGTGCSGTGFGYAPAAGVPMIGYVPVAGMSFGSGCSGTGAGIGAGTGCSGTGAGIGAGCTGGGIGAGTGCSGTGAGIGLPLPPLTPLVPKTPAAPKTADTAKPAPGAKGGATVDDVRKLLDERFAKTDAKVDAVKSAVVGEEKIRGLVKDEVAKQLAGTNEKIAALEKKVGNLPTTKELDDLLQKAVRAGGAGAPPKKKKDD